MAQGRISERNRLEVKFRTTPPVAVRSRLHEAGFKWSPLGRLWWAERDEASEALFAELTRRAVPGGTGGKAGKRAAAEARANPDWSALARQSGELVSRGARASAEGATRAATWAAPRVRRAGAATWRGLKQAGSATVTAVRKTTRKAARRAAPHIASGLRSGANHLDRWTASQRDNPTTTGRGR